MKRILFSLAIYLFCSCSLSAEQLSIEYKFDLIDSNKRDLIVEPPGDLSITVSIDMSGDPKSKNPFTKQVLRDAALKNLKQIKNLIELQIQKTNELIADTNSLAECQKLVKTLDSTYFMLVDQAQNEAETLIRQKWDEMSRQKKILKIWKMEIAYQIARDSFGLARSATEAASSAGVSLAAEILEISQRIYSLSKNIRKLAVNERTARNALVKAAESVRKKLDGQSLGKRERIIDMTSGLDKKLEQAMDLHQKKLIALSHDSHILAIKLQNGFDKESELVSRLNRHELDKKNKQSLQTTIKKIESARKNLLTVNENIVQAISNGNEIQKRSDELWKTARDHKPDHQKIQLATRLAQKIHAAAVDIKDAMDSTEALLSTAEKAADSGVKVLKKMILPK